VLLQKEKIDVKYNVISKEMQISIPERKSEYIQDLGEEAQLAELEDRCIKNFVPHQRMVVNLPLIAREYNPVRDWIESVAWDGTSRLQELMDTIDAEENALKEILMTKWLHGCVAVGCRPEGANLEGVLILQGKQALGKTSWVKRLLPNPEWFLEGATLDPSDKDSVRSVLAHFIVELGELGSTFKRADIDKLKAFITKSKDELRLPYGRAFSRYVRRTAFFGSVNEREFLTDATGNRRFWTVRCKSINFKHKINMQQLWAEMWHKSQEAKEEMWFLTSEEREMLQGSNEMSRTRSAVEELILQHVHFDSIRTEPVQMVKLLKDIGVPNPRVGDFKEASRVLHERGYTARKSNGRKIYDIDYEKADESSFGNKNWND
jgi:putative DNA primase/helicase